MVGLGVNSNGHVRDEQANLVADRIQVEGDQGEQVRTERRGFGTGTVHKEAEGRRMDGFGSGNDTPRR